MKKVFNAKTKAGSQEQNKPRLLSEILSEYFAGDSPLARAYRDHIFDSLFPHTEPCCQLKLLTRKPGRPQEGKMLDGIIMRDNDEHYVFLQNCPKKEKKRVSKRHPIVFQGCCINVHRESDGMLRLAFRRPHYDANFTFRDFCLTAVWELNLIEDFLAKKTIIE